MSAMRLDLPPTAFAGPRRKRQPRRKEGSHLEFIRSLPCLICGTTWDIHAAHLRAGSLENGKRETGAAEKPDDSWTLPLCAEHHVFGPDAQHRSGELEWWEEHGINPFVVALALYRASRIDDRDAALLVIEMARNPDSTEG
ncbi:MAG: hypothetical protein GY788_05070 [bacterium]|nr:hypothetical protein [bacterium]